MKAHGSTMMTDECFARFDEAFAKLEKELDATHEPAKQPSRSLKEYDDAFSQIDRQLAEHRVPGPPGTSRPVNLSLVPPAPLSGAERAEMAALSPIAPQDELWAPAASGTPLERLVGTVQSLLWLLRAIQTAGAGGSERVRVEDVSRVFSDARQLCADFDLPTARVRADFALSALEEDRLDHVAHEVAELVRHIRHDLRSCSIWPIPRRSVWAFSVSLGETATRAFPSSSNEIAEAGRCLGFGFYGAAAFHLMRAAAPGMRALACAAGAPLNAQEPADWATLVTVIEGRLAKVARWPAGLARTAAHEFYSSVLSDARLFQSVAQKLPTPAVVIEEHLASALYQTTHAFLTRLSARMTETQGCALTRRDFAPTR